MLIEKLQRQFAELTKENKSEDAIIISFKEEFHHYILNFIYTNNKYSHLTMYGGSVLRIGYGLNRMSEDLDFQTAKKINKEEFRKALEQYFKDNYNLDSEVSAGSPDKETDLFYVKFDILKNFNFQSIKWQKLQIRIDINYFAEADSFIKDVIPIIRDNLVYTIKTYPLSTLMASKTTAFLRRNQRGIGSIVTNVKPRDVFDMMWYMEQKITPDLEYLKVRGFNFQTFFDFKDDVKKRVNNIEDKVFKDDLAQFFFEPNALQSWLLSWRVKFIQLLDNYEVYEVGHVESIYFSSEFISRNRLILYEFKTLNKNLTKIKFAVSVTDNWFSFSDYKLNFTNFTNEIKSKIQTNQDYNLSELEHQYIWLFYTKIMDFIKRSGNTVYQDSFTTKKIRTTADNLVINKEICLDKRLLEKIRFEELM